MRVLELFSGIGGMHFALNESGEDGEIIAAIDINTTANLVYKHNFPKTNALNKNIQALTAEFINDLNVDSILMSPPCQPFTRNGLRKDVKDTRSSAFLHVLDILPELHIKNILIENVKGFETSEMRNLLVEQLQKCDYVYREFMLSPHQFGIPNSRHRYYCLAKKVPGTFPCDTGAIMDNIACLTDEIKSHIVSEYLEKNVDTSPYLLSETILRKYATILDISFSHSLRTCCFTKAYGRYIEGTGSVYTDKSEEELHKVYQDLKLLNPAMDDYVQNLMKLNLRFFTPTEVARLMSFPAIFSFPEISNKQKYMLLGNSINVKVVAELIKLLNKRGASLHGIFDDLEIMGGDSLKIIL